MENLDLKGILPSLDSGHRVKIAIVISGLRLKNFCHQTSLPLATVCAWMSNRIPLTLKGAKRLENALSFLNISCSSEWLLSGQGPAPCLLKTDQSISPPFFDPHLTHEISLYKEIDFFKSLNPTYRVSGIRDDSMLPFYNQGDFVGGYELERTHFSEGLNQHCIIETVDALSLVRKLNKGSKKDLYNLSATNVLSKAKNLILPNIRLKNVSVIIWHRKHKI